MDQLIIKPKFMRCMITNISVTSDGIEIWSQTDVKSCTRVKQLLDSFHKHLSDLFAMKSLLMTSAPVPQVGDTLLTHMANDLHFYRVVVTHVDQQSNRALVSYIDFGSEDWVQFKHLVVCDQLFEEKSLAQRFFLADIKHKTNGWDVDKVVSCLNQFLMHSFQCEVIGITKNTECIRVYDNYLNQPLIANLVQYCDGYVLYDSSAEEVLKALDIPNDNNVFKATNKYLKSESVNTDTSDTIKKKIIINGNNMYMHFDDSNAILCHQEFAKTFAIIGNNNPDLIKTNAINDIPKATILTNGDTFKATKLANNDIPKPTVTSNMHSINTIEMVKVDVSNASELTNSNTSKAIELANNDISKAIEIPNTSKSNAIEVSKSDTLKTTQLTNNISNTTKLSNGNISYTTELISNDISSVSNAIELATHDNTSKSIEMANRDTSKNFELDNENIHKTIELVNSDKSKEVELANKDVSKSIELVKSDTSKEVELVIEDISKAIEATNCDTSKDTELTNNISNATVITNGVTSKDTELVDKDISKTIELVNSDTSNANELTDNDMSKPIVTANINSTDAIEVPKIDECNATELTNTNKSKVINDETSKDIELDNTIISSATVLTSGDTLKTTELVNSEPIDNVFISATYSDMTFYCQLSSKFDEINALTENMTQYYSNNNTGIVEALDIKSLKVNDTIAAPFSGDGQWYRANIKAINSDEIDIQFIDYGNTEKINANKCRVLKADYSLLKPQAYKCSLVKESQVTYDELKRYENDMIEIVIDVIHSNGNDLKVNIKQVN